MTAPGAALPVLYRDDALIVVDKPAGLAVHRGWAPERDVVVARVREMTGGATVHLAHRLDRGTSGALVIAFDPETAATLGDAFAGGEVSKRYVALVRGHPPDSGTIDHPLRTRDDANAERVPASTSFTRLEVIGRYSLVEARPHTGRRHQIRRHLKHISCPLVGDVEYGRSEHNRWFRERFGLHRLFLHAAALSFAHPRTGERLHIECPLAQELVDTLAALRADGGAGPPRAAPRSLVPL